MAHYKLESNASTSSSDSQCTLDAGVVESLECPVCSNTITPSLTKQNKLPAFIPPDRSSLGRTLILCFDGTGNEFDADNSNIVQLVSLLKKDDSTKQMVYYQPGIGTYESSNTMIPWIIYKYLDEMFAWSIDAHVMGGYKFLMEHYVTGDKISLFGFSRGAYTARSLAGMLHRVGLLPAGNFQQVPFAYKTYKGGKDSESEAFKNALSREVTIDFIGVWDTVSSVGFVPKLLPVSTARTMTRIFRHALCLDERRVKFQANFWHSYTKNESHQVGDLTKKASQEPVDCTEEESQAGDCVAKNTIQPVEEVWFAGCHCDVGGSSVCNEMRYSLARIPLRWMIRECFKANTGIKFNSNSFSRIGLDPSTLYGAMCSRRAPLGVSTSDRIRALFHQGDNANDSEPSGLPFNTEEEEELYDAISRKYDELRINRAWWIPEILPIPQVRMPGRGGIWVEHYWPHFGRPRVIPDQEVHHVKVHRSVKLRMEDKRTEETGKRYVPRALFDDVHKSTWAHDVKVTWVD